MTVARPSLEDDHLSFEALSFLASYLDKHGPPGISHRYGKPPPLRLLSLQITANDAAGELTVAPVWFLGPHRNDFVPIPVDGRMSFQVTQTRAVGSDPSASPAYEHILYGDASDVVSAVIRWKAAGPEAGAQPAPPIGPDAVAYLRTIAAAGSEPVELALAFDPAVPPIALTPGSREVLAADVANISSALLSRYLPRDAKGRLALNAAVLLASYQSDQPLGGKSAWLVALTPTRRRGPQAVQIAVRAIAEGPYPHIWDKARWLWDGRAEEAPEEARWGVAGLDLGLLGPGDRPGRIEDVRRRCASSAALADRVALCILLQDEGRLEEAFWLFGIALGDEVARLIHGQPISGYLGTHLASWTVFLQQQLRAAAPWLMPPVLSAETERRAGLRSKPRRPPRFRLFSLPHQTSQVKRSVMLAARKMDGTKPALEIEDTGWDYRLPEPAWKRPLEIDLRRFGLIGPTRPTQ